MLAQEIKSTHIQPTTCRCLEPQIAMAATRENPSNPTALCYGKGHSLPFFEIILLDNEGVELTKKNLMCACVYI